MRYKAAYWVDDKDAASVQLTGEEELHFPDEYLLILARNFCEDTGLKIEGGQILIREWK